MCGNVVMGGIVGICAKVAVVGIVGVSGRVAVGCVVIISVEVVVGGIVGISVEVTVGGIFGFGAMAVGGSNVVVGMDLGSTVVVNDIDVVCLFCFCCVLGGNVVDPDLLLDHLQSLTKSSAGFSSFSLFSISLALFNSFSLSSDPEPTTFPCETFTIASQMELANFS